MDLKVQKKVADGLQEVSKAGTGFLLMKKHVFEKLKLDLS